MAINYTLNSINEMLNLQYLTDIVKAYLFYGGADNNINLIYNNWIHHITDKTVTIDHIIAAVDTNNYDKLMIVLGQMPNAKICDIGMEIIVLPFYSRNYVLYSDINDAVYHGNLKELIYHNLIGNRCSSHLIDIASSWYDVNTFRYIILQTSHDLYRDFFGLVCKKSDLKFLNYLIKNNIGVNYRGKSQILALLSEMRDEIDNFDYLLDNVKRHDIYMLTKTAIKHKRINIIRWMFHRKIFPGRNDSRVHILFDKLIENFNRTQADIDLIELLFVNNCHPAWKSIIKVQSDIILSRIYHKSLVSNLTNSY